MAKIKELKSIASKESLVVGCQQCLLVDFEARICTAFLEPAYQFRDGRDCWGKCEDPLEMARRLEAMANYASSKSKSMAAKLRHEAESWRQVARLAADKEVS